MNSYLRNLSRLILTFIVIALISCQSTGRRLQKEYPNSVFLRMESGMAEAQKANRILSFFSDKKCRTDNMDSSTVLVCPQESSVYLEALEAEGILEKSEGSFYTTKPTEDSKRVTGTHSPISKFEEGDIQASLDIMEMGDNKSKKEFIVLKKKMEEKISQTSEALARILKQMTEGKEMDSSLERSFLNQFSPYYLKDESLSRAVDNFLEEYSISEETICRVETREPNSAAFVMSGFEEAVLGNLMCENPFGKKVELQVEGNQFLTIGGNLDKIDRIAVRGGEEFSYSVNGLSMNQEENVVRYSIHPRYKSSIDRLVKAGKDFPFNIRLDGNSYVFQTIPSSFSPEYDRWESEFSGGREVIGSIQNGKVSATLASDGKFTMGGRNAQGDYDLMFGHPNGKFANGIWSSFTAVKVGEEVFNLHSFPNEVVEQGENRVETSTLIGETGIRVHTIWEKSLGTENGLDLGYRIVNTKTSKQSVGIRVFLDTWAGYSDGVPFALPGHTENKDRVITEEISFNPHTSAIWETTDYHSEGNVFLQNQLVGGDLTPPDEVQLVNWGSAFGKLWDYEVSETRSVTGDSAAAIVWLPREIAGNRELIRRTRFLSIERGEGYSFRLDSEVTSSGVLVVNKDFGNCENLQLAFSQKEGKPLTREGRSIANFTLSPGQRSTLQVPITLQGMGQSELEIRETCGGVANTFRLRVNLPSEDYSMQAPLAKKDSEIPVQFTSKKPDRRIEARLIDPSDESVISKTDLKEEKQGSLFLYKGSLKTSGEGGYVVEYLDKEAPAEKKESTKPLSSGGSPSVDNPEPKRKSQVRPKEIDLPKGHARLILKSGEVKEGKIISDSLEEIRIQIGKGTEDRGKYSKRELKSIRYGKR